MNVVWDTRFAERRRFMTVKLKFGILPGRNTRAQRATRLHRTFRVVHDFFQFLFEFFKYITIRTRVIYKRSFCAEVIIGLTIRFHTGLPRTPNIIFFWQGVARYRTVIIVVTTTVWQHLIVWVWMKNYLQPSMVRETLYSLAAITVESDLKTSLLMDLQECNLQKKNYSNDNYEK